MNENIVPTKEDLKEVLTQAKESVSAFALKIENQADLEKLAEGDIEDLKDNLESFNERISNLEERMSALPESPTANQEIQDLIYIKQQLSSIAHTAESKIKDYFSIKPENEILKVEKVSEGKETINLHSPGCIFDPELLDKIAKLEAINHDTFEFDQACYDKYIDDEKRGMHGERSVTSNQEKIKRMIDKGEDMQNAIAEGEVIYGISGLNRYFIDINGEIKLASGNIKDNTSGTQEYFDAIRAKGNELGMNL